MNTQFQEKHARAGSGRSPRAILSAIAFATLGLMLPAPAGAQTEPYQTVDGLSVYLGVMPSVMIRRQLKAAMPRHGGAPSGKHAYHVMIAVFDATSGERQQNLNVRARVSGRGLGGTEKALHPMTIAGTVTYGDYFILPPDTYRIQVEIRQPGRAQPVHAEFIYERGLH